MKRVLLLLLVTTFLCSIASAENHHKHKKGHAKKHVKNHAKQKRGHELRAARRSKLRARLEKAGETSSEIDRLMADDDKKNQKVEFPDGELTKEELEAKNAGEAEKSKEAHKEKRHRKAGDTSKREKATGGHKKFHDKLKGLPDDEKRAFVKKHIKAMIKRLRAKGLSKEEIQERVQAFRKKHVKKHMRKRHHQRKR